MLLCAKSLKCSPGESYRSGLYRSALVAHTELVTPWAGADSRGLGISMLLCAKSLKCSPGESYRSGLYRLALVARN